MNFILLRCEGFGLILVEKTKQEGQIRISALGKIRYKCFNCTVFFKNYKCSGLACALIRTTW